MTLYAFDLVFGFLMGILMHRNKWKIIAGIFLGTVILLFAIVAFRLDTGEALPDFSVDWLTSVFDLVGIALGVGSSYFVQSIMEKLKVEP